MVFLVLFALILVLLICFLVVPLSVRIKVYFSLDRGTVMLRLYALGICVLKARVITQPEGLVLAVNGKEPRPSGDKKQGVSFECVKEVAGHLKYRRLTATVRAGGGDAAEVAVLAGAIRSVLELACEMIDVKRQEISVLPDFDRDGVDFDFSLYLTFNTV